MGKFLAGAVLAAVVSATPAMAENSAPPPGKTVDPNEIVCEKQEVMGSRLGSKRVCMTRAEWAEQRRLDRQDIDHAQTMRGTKGE